MSEKETFMQKLTVVLLGAFICSLLWGSAFPSIKIGYEWMGSAAALAFVCIGIWIVNGGKKEGETA